MALFRPCCDSYFPQCIMCTSSFFFNNTMKQKRSKAIDMSFYWIRDRTKQGQFFVYWDSGKNNLADFYT